MKNSTDNDKKKNSFWSIYDDCKFELSLWNIDSTIIIMEY
jgi:hypothetical protein